MTFIPDDAVMAKIKQRSAQATWHLPEQPEDAPDNLVHGERSPYRKQ